MVQHKGAKIMLLGGPGGPMLLGRPGASMILGPPGMPIMPGGPAGIPLMLGLGGF